MKLDNCHYLEYSDYCPNLYHYTMFRQICPSAFFMCFMSNLEVQTESLNENYIWTIVNQSNSGNHGKMLVISYS